MKHVAVIGLGAMGSRLALNLLLGGFAVTVWNRDPLKAEPLKSKGAVVADSPRAAAINAEIVLSMVRDDEAAADVWLDPGTGALASMKPGSIAVECSTLSFGFVRRLAQRAATLGIGFLDAPVLGSRPQADARQLIHLVGGEARTLAAAEPVLRAASAAIHHVGPVGAGMAIKLAVNSLFAIQVAALGEVLAVLDKQGIGAARVAEVLEGLPVTSPSAKGAIASMVAGSYAPLFPVELASKDLEYALSEARLVNAATPLATSAWQVFDAAVRHGHGSLHLTAIRQLYS